MAGQTQQLRCLDVRLCAFITWTALVWTGIPRHRQVNAAGSLDLGLVDGGLVLHTALPTTASLELRAVSGKTITSDLTLVKSSQVAFNWKVRSSQSYSKTIEHNVQQCYQSITCTHTTQQTY